MRYLLAPSNSSLRTHSPAQKSDAEANASVAEVSRLVPPTPPSSSLPPSVNRTPRPPVVASEFDSEDDEEEEEDRILAELQVRTPIAIVITKRSCQ